MKINCCDKTVRSFSFMPAKQGTPGEGQDEGIKNQTVALFDPLSPALSRREKDFMGQQ
jgi:hypothetical protein